MTTFWIVVADAGRAILLSRKGSHGKLAFEHEMDNPSGRLHTSELVSDGRGRLNKSGGSVQSAMESHTDPHEQQATQFAHDVCNVIDDAASAHAFDSLVMLAPAHFLGLLHAKLGKVAKKRIAYVQAKDLVHVRLDELGVHLNEMTFPAMAASK